MVILIGYLLLVFVLLIFLITISLYTFFLLYSSFKGSPYVATRKKRIEKILKEANLKKGKIFIELGCGDGRIVRTAVKKYGVKGIGVDINPILIFWARLLSLKDSSTSLGMTFRVENIFDTDLTKTDYVYIFLMPDLISKLIPKLKKELKKNCLIISHGFKVEGMKLVKTLETRPFKTYYYRT